MKSKVEPKQKSQTRSERGRSAWASKSPAEREAVLQRLAKARKGRKTKR